MKRMTLSGIAGRICTCLAGVAVLSLLCAVAGGGMVQANQPSVQRASCVLLLKGGGRAMDIKTVGEIITSTSFADAAAKEALGLEPAQWPRVAQIELAPAGIQSLKVIVTVRPAEGVALPDAAAAALLAEITQRAQREVERVMNNTQQREALQKQVEDLRQRRDAAVNRVEALGQRLGELRQQRPAAPIRSAPDGALVNRRQIAEQLARNRLRLEALEAVLPRMEEFHRELNTPLDELVDLHQRKVQMLQQQVDIGRASPLELLDAQIQLAEARSRRSGLAEGEWRSSPVQRYLSEIVSLRVEIGVAEAQLALMGGPATQPSTQQVPDDPEDLASLINRLTQEHAAAQREASTLSSELSAAERRLAELGPPVQLVVVDGRE